MYRSTFPKSIFQLILKLILMVAVGTGQITWGSELVISECWSYPIEPGRTIITDGIRLYLVTTDARVEAVSLDGKKHWSTELGGEIASNIAVSRSNIFIVNLSSATGDKQSSASLRALSKDTGITTWSVRLGSFSEHTLVSSESAITIISGNGVLQSVDARSGNSLWKREIAYPLVGKPDVFDDTALIASQKNQLFNVSLATGEIESMRKVPSTVTAARRTSDDGVIIGDEQGNVSLLSVSDSKAIWRYKSGGAISGIRIVNDHALITSNDNFVYYLRLKNGGLSWKRRFAGRVTRVSIFNNSQALVSSLEEHGGTFIDLVSGRSVGQVAFAGDEFMQADPIFSNGLILVLTNGRVIAYNLNRCSSNK